MFTEQQQLEFNKAFVLRTIQSAEAEIERLKALVHEVTDEEPLLEWNDVKRRPMHVVGSLAWNRQLKVLLSVRMKQYQLQEKMLETGNSFPTEWADVEYEQKEAVRTLRNLDLSRTRTSLMDIADCLLGPQQQFLVNRTVDKSGKRKNPATTEKKVKYCHGLTKI